jgi:hypothetical protein
MKMRKRMRMKKEMKEDEENMIEDYGEKKIKA